MNEQGLGPGEPTRIHAARGSLREGLAALQNFENLLRSPRVGPRSVAGIVGELRDGSVAIGNALEVLLTEISHREPAADVVRQLSDYVRCDMRMLDSALGRAAQGGLGAKARLALEADVHRVSDELGTVRRLIDLLEAATGTRTTELESSALLEASVNAMAANGSSTSARTTLVRVQLSVQTPSLSVITDPQAVVQLVAIGVGLVAATGARNVSVTLIQKGDSVATMRIAPCDAGRPVALCAPPSVIFASVEVARLASRSIGATFTQHLDGWDISLPVNGAASLRPATHPVA